MIKDASLHLSRGLVGAVRAEVSIHHRERIPAGNQIIVVSNHRSLFDAPLLMAAMNRPVRFACHHYMGRVPLLREMVSAMGAFPLDAPSRRQKNFFRQALKLLKSGQAVGVFPEGAKPMIERNAPEQLNPFHRGFAHLALRAPMDDLAILPVAIASIDEATHHLAPLKLFSLVDPSEPLFHSEGWHRVTMYRRVHLFFGHPVWISDTLRKQYCGHHGGSLARELTHSCWNQISGLLQQGCC